MSWSKFSDATPELWADQPKTLGRDKALSVAIARVIEILEHMDCAGADRGAFIRDRERVLRHLRSFNDYATSERGGWRWSGADMELTLAMLTEARRLIIGPTAPLAAKAKRAIDIVGDLLAAVWEKSSCAEGRQ